MSYETNNVGLTDFMKSYPSGHETNGRRIQHCGLVDLLSVDLRGHRPAIRPTCLPRFVTIYANYGLTKTTQSFKRVVDLLVCRYTGYSCSVSLASFYPCRLQTELLALDLAISILYDAIHFGSNIINPSTFITLA